MRFLVRAGASARDAAAGVNAVFSYVLGYAVVEAGVPPASDHNALRDAALTHLGTNQPPSPHLDAAIDLMSDPGDFHAGLDVVLDGSAHASAGKDRPHDVDTITAAPRRGGRPRPKLDASADARQPRR